MGKTYPQKSANIPQKSAKIRKNTQMGISLLLVFWTFGIFLAFRGLPWKESWTVSEKNGSPRIVDCQWRKNGSPTPVNSGQRWLLENATSWSYARWCDNLIHGYAWWLIGTTRTFPGTWSQDIRLSWGCQQYNGNSQWVTMILLLYRPLWLPGPWFYPPMLCQNSIVQLSQ